MTTHALYRFFGSDDSLLYIGLTCNPGNRFSTHADEKLWWHEVTRISLETFPDRDTVERAEVAAIVSEHPRYNVMHNGGTVNSSARPRVEPRVVVPIQEGDVVALGLEDGTCPVGIIEAIDEEWLRLDLMSFWDGYFGVSTEVVRRSEIKRIKVARQMTQAECIETRHCFRSRRDTDVTCFDTAQLETFQTDWRASHGDQRAIDRIVAEVTGQVRQ